MASTLIKNNSRDPCYDWPKGQCKHGEDCKHEHHEKLDPALEKLNVWKAPNEVGEACHRCMQRIYPASIDDPCSECRWFGGENCRCVLAEKTSYNDQIWSIMMKRGPEKDYTLPLNMDRMEGPRKSTAKGGPKVVLATEPMPANKVKADWQGETKQALLDKGDMLPEGVRGLPRASLVPPRPFAAGRSQAHKRGLEYEPQPAVASTTASGLSSFLPLTPAAALRSPAHERGLEYEPQPAVASTSASGHPSFFPLPPAFPRPPTDPLHGPVRRTTYVWDTAQWQHEYDDGVKLTGPAMLPSLTSTNPEPFAKRRRTVQSHESTVTRPRNNPT